MALTVTATPDPTSTPPSVQVHVTDTSGTTSAVVVQRMVGGVTSGTVRTGDGGPTPLVSGSASLLDGEAPFGIGITYVVNGTAFTVPVMLDVSRPWLINPGRPGLSMPITIADAATRSHDVRQGVLWPLMRERPIVRTDGRRRAPAASVTVKTHTLAELAALDALLADASVLLLNVPLSNQWGLGAEYIAVGKVDEDRLAPQTPAFPTRHWTVPYQVTDAPLGGSGGTSSFGNRTFADLNAELQADLGHAPTWTEAAAKYRNRADAASGTAA